MDPKTEQNLPITRGCFNNWLEPGFEPGTSCIRSTNDSHYTIRARTLSDTSHGGIYTGRLPGLEGGRYGMKEVSRCSGVVKEDDGEDAKSIWRLIVEEFQVEVEVEPIGRSKW